MIKVDQYEYIRTAHRVYGKSIREIQRQTGHDRKTIRKALRSEPKGYAKRKAQPYPVLGPYMDLIDSWLEWDKEVGKKQRHTATRIYHRLVHEAGFKGSESAVRHYVREAKVRLGVNRVKAFIPLEPEGGKEAEVDWGGATAILAGEPVRLKFFCMRSKYSGKHFVRFYPCERQQAFFDAHIHAFGFFGGVFGTLIYDNLKAAVQKVLRGKDRVQQEAFKRFQSYYNFKAQFCNVASGHEKGGVEGLVGFARRNYMVPIPKAESIEELNGRVLQECLVYGNHRIQGREKRVNELFEEEKEHLIGLPSVGFTNIEGVESKVNPYATVILDKNRYSVPSRYVGLKVRGVLGVDWVQIFYEGKRIATHRRVFGNNKWQLDPDHYLELLQQRPGAFNAARPIREWRKNWPEALEQLLSKFVAAQGETNGTRDFISVLMLYREQSPSDVHAAVDLALENGISSSAGVKHLLLHCHCGLEFEPLEGWPTTLIPNVSIYGQLGGV
jgi:transposase